MDTWAVDDFRGVLQVPWYEPGGRAHLGPAEGLPISPVEFHSPAEGLSLQLARTIFALLSPSRHHPIEPVRDMQAIIFKALICSFKATNILLHDLPQRPASHGLNVVSEPHGRFSERSRFVY